MPSLPLRPWLAVLCHGTILGLLAAWLGTGSLCPAQGFSLGPSSSTPVAAPIPWPAQPPTRIYVVPFPMEPLLQQQLEQEQQNGAAP